MKVSPTQAAIASKEAGIQVFGEIRRKYRLALAGKMKDFTQDEFAELLVRDGHRISILTGDCDYLVVGKGNMRKQIALAETLGVRVISEEELRELLR